MTFLSPPKPISTSMDYSIYTAANLGPPGLSMFRSRKDGGKDARKDARKDKDIRKIRKNRADSTTSRSTHSTTGTIGSGSTATATTSPAKAKKPLIYNQEYYGFLEKGVDELKTDYVSGAREMAGKALGMLGTAIELAAMTARDGEELWGMGVGAARVLGEARGSMSAAITACLLRALSSIEELWHSQNPDKTPADLAIVASEQIRKIKEERKATGVKLGEAFAKWVNRWIDEKTGTPDSPSRTLHILTLSNSSTIRTALLTLLTTTPTLHLTLTVLESRPRCEGADLAAHLHASLSPDDKPRLTLHILPDSAVGSAFLAPSNEDTTTTTTTTTTAPDIVLLGADRISATGDVSNKIGSLAAASCARVLSPAPKTRVVVLSDEEKITAADSLEHFAENHDPQDLTGAWGWRSKARLEADMLGVGKSEEEKKEGSVSVWGEWFEVVPRGLVDVYVTEGGVLGQEGVQEVGRKMGELQGRVFGGVEGMLVDGWLRRVDGPEK